MGEETYPDNDNDGIPDAFENRKPLAELLGFEILTDDREEETFFVEIEKSVRAAKQGEMFLWIGSSSIVFVTTQPDRNSTTLVPIVRRIIKSRDVLRRDTFDD